jgi:glutathione S-transferase
MKLYIWPGACSQAPHIVSREVGINLDLAPLDRTERRAPDGTLLSTINPKNQVPALVLDDGQVLTEVGVISQYLADRKPGNDVLPPAGTLERYRVMEWLSFVSSELHKTFAPLFRPNTPDDYKTISKANLAQRFDWLEKVLDGKQYLTGDKFTAADAYLFVVSRWSPRVGVDLAKWPNLTAFIARVAARPKVQEALKAEGL